MEKWSSKVINPYEQNRKTVRLEHHDYASSGTYYLTVSTHQGQHYFGEIVDNKMVLSPQGKIVQNYLSQLVLQSSKISKVTFIVMPHHFHLLFYYDNGASRDSYILKTGQEAENMREVRRNETRAGTISSLVRSIKSGITRECHRAGYEIQWLSRFYDHIVRSSFERDVIRRYIEENPIHWNNPKTKNPLGFIDFYK